jgi:hypothetical protein
VACVRKPYRRLLSLVNMIANHDLPSQLVHIKMATWDRLSTTRRAVGRTRMRSSDFPRNHLIRRYFDRCFRVSWLEAVYFTNSPTTCPRLG